MATSPSNIAGKTLETQVLDIVKELLVEQGKARAAESLTTHSSFQRDLGLASLDLVELLVRCESRLDVELPEDIAEQADTPAGWVRAIQSGGQDAVAKSVYRVVPPEREAPAPPHHAVTLLDVLQYQAEIEPGRIHVHYLAEDGSGEGVAAGVLYDSAVKAARGLLAAGLKRQDAVAIVLPNKPEFFEAFFGVMLAGGIPVPIYPPAGPARLAEYVERQTRILRNAGVRFLIAFDQIESISRLLRVNLAGLADVTDVATLKDFGSRGAGRLPAPSDIALVQYTSGTTGDPKGVILRHDRVLANLRAIGKAVSVRSGDALVSWLPLASDMGLVGCWLFSLYFAAPLTMMSPLEFLRRPESWLWAIHDSRGTLSAAPNFAYELCTQRIPAWSLEGIDLSCWRMAVNGGEMVLHGTLRRFVERFGRNGFRPESFAPCYGLAESTVALCMSRAGSAPEPDRVRRADIERTGVAEPAAAGEDAIEFFSVGSPIDGMEVRIVGDGGAETGQRVQGRIQFRGLSLAEGYFNDSAASAASFPGGWMDSGDLAYRVGNEIHITGRWKDVIVRAGRSLSPADIEAAAMRAPGVLNNGVIAIGLVDSTLGTERLILVAETDAEARADLLRVEKAVRENVAAHAGEPPDEVLLIPPGTLPKTANGKMRRSQTRALYLEGKLGRKPASPFVQFTGLWLENAGSLARLRIRSLALTLHRATLNLRAKLAAAGAAGKNSLPQAAGRILRILRHPVAAEGAWPQAAPGKLVVANRISGLDPLALASLLSGPVSFAGTEALLGLPSWARPLVESCCLLGVGQMEASLRAGETIVLFPDGPLGAPAWRCRYRMTALHAAASAGATVLPVAIREMNRQVVIAAAPGIAANHSPAGELREAIRAAINDVYA